MHWNVEGADTVTGEDRVITVDAADEVAAEAHANRQGLVVSAVYRSTVKSPAEALDEMVGTGTMTAPVALSLASRGPEYADVTNGARMLRIFGSIAAILGILSLCAAALAGVLVAKGASETGNGNPAVAALAAAIPFIGTGFVSFVIAVSLKMYASLALAVRDIACNSFRREGGDAVHVDRCFAFSSSEDLDLAVISLLQPSSSTRERPVHLVG